MDDHARDYVRYREVPDDVPRSDGADPRPQADARDPRPKADSHAPLPLSEAESPPPSDRLRPPAPWKRRFGIGAAVIVGIALIGGGIAWWLNARHYVSTDDAFIDGYTTQMAPQVAGRVTALLVQDNQHVAAGQVLLRIDPRDYQAKLDQATAQRANAAAQLEQARAQVAMQQAAADQSQATVRAADADLTNARQDYERYRAIDPHAVTRQQVDSATATYHSAQAKLDADREAAKGAESQVQAAQAQVQAAQAQVQIADANVESARLQLSYTTLAAPVAGRIAHRGVNLGDYVNPGQALFAIVQDNVWVTANFKETQLKEMKVGQDVKISVDALGGRKFHGTVVQLGGATGSSLSLFPPENATGNYVKVVQRIPVRINFDNLKDEDGDYKLRIGMSADPTVRVK